MKILLKEELNFFKLIKNNIFTGRITERLSCGRNPEHSSVFPQLDSAGLHFRNTDGSQTHSQGT